MKVNYLGREGQERMERNGWWIELAEDYFETPEEMYARLTKKWAVVKIYWVGTRIRGCHTYFAMCKKA